LAFARSISESVYSIYLLSLSPSYLAAGEPQPLPSFPNLRVGTPQWTFDGRDLLFSANPQTGMAIWRMLVPPVGEAPQPPRREPYGRGSFRIRIGRPSAASQRLIYSAETQERNVWRVALGATGGKPVKLNILKEGLAAARISPDGTRIAFESMRTGATEVWVANADGTDPHALTNFGGPVTGSPVWSPDGHRIAFDSRAEGRPHIYVISAGGGRPERVTQALAENFLPSWSHDGRWLYFCSSRSGSIQVWRQRDNGADATQLTQQGGCSPVESPDGAFLYYQRTVVPSGWSLRRLTLASGKDIEFLPVMSERAFEVAPGGIYYVPASADGRFTIQYYDFETKTFRLIARILRPLPRRMALSPDGSSLLYSQLDRFGFDLMMVENFR
jgi:Tol biopolymer transport system component